MSENDDLMRRFQEIADKLAKQQSSCPSCGRCPHCGRPPWGLTPMPSYPWSPYHPGYPYSITSESLPLSGPPMRATTSTSAYSYEGQMRNMS